MKAWIARDPNGICFVYSEKPTLCKGEEDGECYEYWECESVGLFDTPMPDTFHAEVTYDNSPMPIDFTPDDGIAILTHKKEKLEKWLEGSVVPDIVFATITGEMFMLGHTITMLELLKGGDQ